MAVGDYDVKPFTSPVGSDPQAWQTRNNDNLLRGKFVTHQADTVAHVQSGTAAPTGTAATGAVYFRTLAGSEGVYVYNGTTWTLISGASGPGWTPQLVNVIWGTVGAESSNAIEVPASCADVSGTALTSDEIGVMVIVSDSAADAEPSATATISAASSPVGTLLAGSGTATSVSKTDSSGNFKIRVTETAAASRYIWVRAGGHFQRFVKARDGILQLTFA
jgi:hypothetical protein